MLKNINIIIDKLKEVTKDFSILFEEGLTILAQNGWYIEEQSGIIKTIELIKMIQIGEVEKVDLFFKDYYTVNSKSILKRQLELYPNRAGIITEAYRAHKLKMYHASTCLFLSQADGICKGELFKTRRQKESLKEFLSSNYPTKSIPNMLKVLTKENAIDVYHPEKSKYSSQLNRHGVFHGYDTDYGNEINSLKALSLLAFVTGFVQRYKLRK